MSVKLIPRLKFELVLSILSCGLIPLSCWFHGSDGSGAMPPGTIQMCRGVSKAPPQAA